ncbi:MAG: DUF6788 family protein [Verrucomicrobiales bacterium]
MHDKNLPAVWALGVFCGGVYVYAYTVGMTKNPHLKNLMEEISSIQRMERGHLSIIRQGPGGPYYNLQRRVDGRNLTEYVPRDQVPILGEHIAAHERFKELVTQYEDILTEQSRTLRKQGQTEEAKKKRVERTSTSPEKPKSKA